MKLGNMIDVNLGNAIALCVSVGINETSIPCINTERSPLGKTCIPLTLNC